MSIQLPKVTNQTTDYSELNTIPPDGLKLAMPIEGTTGRMNTMKISSKAQLLKEYSTTSEISPRLSDSILHALKLLQFMPVYTSRVGSTNVLPGRADKPDSSGNYTVFTDAEYSPYYKSSRFNLSKTQLREIKINGTESAYKDIFDAIVNWGNAKNVTDNGKLVNFISSVSITEFEVDGDDITDNSDWSKNELGDLVEFKLSGEDHNLTSTDAKDFHIDINGLNFKSRIQNNTPYDGTPIPLNFYWKHGSNSKDSYIITNAWTEGAEGNPTLRYSAYLVYIIDYLKSSGLTTPLFSDASNFEFSYSGCTIEVIGDELNNCLDTEIPGTIKVKTNSYTPNNCGFKITIGNNVYGIAVGDIDLSIASGQVDKGTYLLSSSEFSTVEKLVYRLFEVLSNANISDWLPKSTITIVSNNFKPIYYFNPDSLLISEVSPDETYIKFEDSSTTYYSYSVGNTNYQLANLTYENQYIVVTRVIGDISTSYTYYNGEYPFDVVPGNEYIRLSASPLNYSEFLSLLISALKTQFNCTYSEIANEDRVIRGFTLYTKDVKEKFTLSVPDTKSGYIFDESLDTTAKDRDYTQVINNASLIVVSTGLNSENILKFKLTKDPQDSELYNLLLTRKNDEESYVISFVEDKVDGYGVMRYFTYVNDDDNGSKYFRLVRVNSDPTNLPKDEVESPLFGAEVKSFKSSTTDWQVAVNRFREFTGDYYDFIFDSGNANVSLGNTVYNVGKDLYAGALLTLPDDKSVDNLIIYRNALGVDHRQVVMRTPRVPDTTLGNFVVYMSPITQYLERLVLNKSAGKEFAPIFGITNGAAALAPKYRYDTEEERQKLCDAQIAPLVWDRARQLPYFLLDLTGQRKDSLLSDFNNVRMDNLIAHLSNEIAQKYVSRFNDPNTRAEFVGEVDVAIQQRLISHQQYRINAYKLVCDESNNPPEVVDARQLILDVYEQYRPGIRWVKIFQGVYNLSTNI